MSSQILSQRSGSRCNELSNPFSLVRFPAFALLPPRVSFMKIDPTKLAEMKSYQFFAVLMILLGGVYFVSLLFTH